MHYATIRRPLNPRAFIANLKKRMASGPDQRRHFITVDNLRAAVTKLVNAAFAARDTEWWGRGTACASDSKKFGSWFLNFMTEYHARYGGNGVMTYWHVERKNVCIYSQLKSCSLGVAPEYAGEGPR